MHVLTELHVHAYRLYTIFSINFTTIFHEGR